MTIRTMIGMLTWNNTRPSAVKDAKCINNIYFILTSIFTKSGFFPFCFTKKFTPFLLPLRCSNAVAAKMMFFVKKLIIRNNIRISWRDNNILLSFYTKLLRRKYLPAKTSFCVSFFLCVVALWVVIIPALHTYIHECCSVIMCAEESLFDCESGSRRFYK